MIRNCNACGNRKAGFCTKNFQVPIYAADHCANWTERKAMTNGDWLRMMTDEDLAEVLTTEACELCARRGKPCRDTACDKGVLAWLKQEAKDAEEL